MSVYDDVFDREPGEDLEVATDRELMLDILDNAKIKYTETEDLDFEDIILTKNGVGFVFNEEGGLVKIIKELKNE